MISRAISRVYSPYNDIPVISYDFDGVLHRSVKVEERSARTGQIKTFGAIKCFDWKSWEPNLEMIRQLKHDARDAIVIIVTSRGQNSRPMVINFLKDQKIFKFIHQIFFCNSESKVPILKQYRVLHHYEDSPQHIAEIEANGIRVIKVTPYY